MQFIPISICVFRFFFSMPTGNPRFFFTRKLCGRPPINAVELFHGDFEPIKRRHWIGFVGKILSSGKRLQKNMENHHAIHGKIHDFDGHFQ